MLVAGESGGAITVTMSRPDVVPTFEQFEPVQSGVFGALSGAAVAVAAVLGRSALPAMADRGYDPIWFRTLFLIILTLGSLTPPFGYTLFALRGATDRLTTAQVYGAAWPVVGIFLIGMLLRWAFPVIVTTLPGLFR